MPSQVRGELLWQNAGLTATERASLSAAVAGDGVFVLFEGTWGRAATWPPGTELRSKNAHRERSSQRSRRTPHAKLGESVETEYEQEALYETEESALGLDEELDDDDDVLALAEYVAATWPTERSRKSDSPARVASKREDVALSWDWPPFRRARGRKEGAVFRREHGNQADHHHHTSLETMNPRSMLVPVETVTVRARALFPAALGLFAVSPAEGHTSLWSAFEGVATRPSATAAGGEQEDPGRPVKGGVAHRDRGKCYEQAASQQLSAAHCVTEELRSYAIVESGGTRSMSGTQLMAHVKEEAWVASRWTTWCE